MQRTYLTISIIVTILGVAFIFLPATYTINLAPEEVTLWEDTARAQLGPYGAVFSFDTGEKLVADGAYPYVKVWSDEAVTLNTTFIMRGSGGVEAFSMTDNPSECVLSGDGTWSVQIEGSVIENDPVDVNAGFYYLRLLEPEQITYYPYRYFGYGMAAIGAIASLIIYLSSKSDSP
jgi:hypothetical protein